MKTILVIEDEGRIVRLIRDYLSEEGYRIIDARDGEEGLTAFERQNPDLIILDLMLPKKDGLDVAREVRKNSEVPIIMLTAKTEEVDRVTGLELGADDYMTKPFSLRELAARIKAVLRRTGGDLGKRGVIRRGELLIDTETHQVKLDGEEVDLTPTEFDLLAAMARNPGRAFTRKSLLEEIGHYPGESVKRKIDTHVKNLRKKLGSGDEPERFIETVHGVGYRFRKFEQDPE
ncbi:MAG: response regulator transcription factor [Candidatus Bipolaricaulota bacterium]|nr:response regulator transcription factor [Candidatus Bipolaricaulota bacterium]MBS3791998.1 response regulator transcription factor [Candidatus Bipolaricaulota bacterium]